MIHKLLLLSCAGAAGTLARYGLAGLVHKLNLASFPWGTLVVNVAGCLVAGLMWSLFESRWPISGEWRVVVLVGFMGAFTTFSTFVIESSELARSAEWMYAASNIVAHNVLGFGALMAGVALARIV